jgi:hypothetical protein
MNETVKTTVSLPRNVWYGLRVAALREGATTSAVVTRALVAAFEKRPPEPGNDVRGNSKHARAEAIEGEQA